MQVEEMGGISATHFCVMKPEYFRTFIIYQQPNVVLFVHVFDKYINIVVDTRLKADRGIHISATFNAVQHVF